MNYAWIHKSAFDELTAETNISLPFETGGCLMGFWEKPYSEVVITQVVGPGSDAIHGYGYFKPDHEWQEKEIARVYAESGRKVTYLGDWHSHPYGNNKLSWRDRKTLYNIASLYEARAPIPIMGITHGWQNLDFTVWKYVPKKIGTFFVGSKKTKFKTRIYE